MRKISLTFIVLVLAAGLASAHEQYFDEAKQLVDSGIGCGELNNEQLEAIGDYYMEQMHPGEAHERMHEMMGGEGSESLKNMHVRMAESMHCGEGGMMGSGGMPGMMQMMNMMGGQNPVQNNMMQGMAGNQRYGYAYWSFLNILYVLLLTGLVVLVYLWIITLWREMKRGRGKR